jgi:hypothetical protein
MDCFISVSLFSWMISREFLYYQLRSIFDRELVSFRKASFLPLIIFFFFLVVVVVVLTYK